MKSRVRTSLLPVKRYVGFSVGVFLLLTWFGVENEAFEWIHEYSRDHEDWELDEIIIALVVGFVVSAATLALISVRQTALLRASLEEQLEQERQLASLRRARSVSMLASGVAHSTNNYLQPIMTLSRMIKKQLPEEAAQQLFLDKILLAAGNAYKVQEELLVYSNPNANKSKNSDSCDLTAVSRSADILLTASVAAPCSLKLMLSEQPLVVGLAETEVTDLLLVLISNAVDSYQGAAGEIVCSIDKHESKALIRVSDKGQGMDEEQKIHAVEPFYTTKNVGEGTGLGLSVVKGLVEGASGHLEIESQIGEGTNVLVSLPIKQ